MGRSRGSRMGRNMRATTDIATPMSSEVTAENKPTPLPLPTEECCMDGIDTTATPSTAAPSESSSPTNQCNRPIPGASSSEEIVPEVEVHADAPFYTATSSPLRLPLAALAPHPSEPARTGSDGRSSRAYKDSLRAKGFDAMQRNGFLRQFVVKDSTQGPPVPSSPAQALGLVSSTSPSAAKEASMPLSLQALCPSPGTPKSLPPQQPAPMFSPLATAFSPNYMFIGSPTVTCGAQYLRLPPLPPLPEDHLGHVAAGNDMSQQLLDIATRGTLAGMDSTQIEACLLAAADCCYED